MDSTPRFDTSDSIEIVYNESFKDRILECHKGMPYLEDVNFIEELNYADYKRINDSIRITLKFLNDTINISVVIDPEDGDLIETTDSSKMKSTINIGFDDGNLESFLNRSISVENFSEVLLNILGYIYEPLWDIYIKALDYNEAYN